MDKAKYLEMLAQLYRVSNASDSDWNREDWTNPAMAGDAGCRHIDQMMRGMLKAGVLTIEEYQSFYDSL